MRTSNVVTAGYRCERTPKKRNVVRNVVTESIKSLSQFRNCIAPRTTRSSLGMCS